MVFDVFMVVCRALHGFLPLRTTPVPFPRIHVTGMIAR